MHPISGAPAAFAAKVHQLNGRIKWRKFAYRSSVGRLITFSVHIFQKGELNQAIQLKLCPIACHRAKACRTTCGVLPRRLKAVALRRVASACVGALMVVHSMHCIACAGYVLLALTYAEESSCVFEKFSHLPMLFNACIDHHDGQTFWICLINCTLVISLILVD